MANAKLQVSSSIIAIATDFRAHNMYVIIVSIANSKLA